jgi:hypothetical protein
MAICAGESSTPLYCENPSADFHNKIARKTRPCIVWRLTVFFQVYYLDAFLELDQTITKGLLFKKEVYYVRRYEGRT